MRPYARQRQAATDPALCAAVCSLLMPHSGVQRHPEHGPTPAGPACPARQAPPLNISRRPPCYCGSLLTCSAQWRPAGSGKAMRGGQQDVSCLTTSPYKPGASLPVRLPQPHHDSLPPSTCREQPGGRTLRLPAGSKETSADGAEHKGASILRSSIAGTGALSAAREDAGCESHKLFICKALGLAASHTKFPFLQSRERHLQLPKLTTQRRQAAPSGKSLA